MDIDAIQYIALGTITTLKYTVCSVSFGFIIALISTYFSFSNNKLLVIINKFYVSIFRGTPLIIQLSIIYYATPQLTSYKIPAFIAGVLAFSLNSAAYLSETIRAGISSIDKGQFEAAKTLGITHNLIMKDIILPQAIRNILPSLINELINMLKESAIISIIGEADLMRRSQLVTAAKYDYFMPLITAACCYYILVTIFSIIGQKIEKKLQS